MKYVHNNTHYVTIHHALSGRLPYISDGNLELINDLQDQLIKGYRVGSDLKYYLYIPLIFIATA